MPVTAAFTDVLRALPLPAADALVAALRGGGSRRSPGLRAARRACRALRDLVDQSVLGLSLKVRAGDVARWRAGWRPPSLARWPRAKNIDINFSHADDADALLLAAPILEGGRQVTELTLQDDSGDLMGLEVAVAALAPQLPALHVLSLTGSNMHAALSFDPAQQAAMYGALAALPCLESLTLPWVKSLDCAGALAGSSSLHSLTIEDFLFLESGEPSHDPFTEQALVNISSLQRLQRLTLDCSLCWSSTDGATDTGGLVALLASLPPSVEELEVTALLNTDYKSHEPGPGGMLNVAISLRQGRIRSLRLEGCGGVEDLFLGNVGLLAGALLSCPTLGCSLEQLELASPLTVPHEELQQMQPLLQLLGRCQQVKLRALDLYPGLSVEQAQELLRRLPQAEELRLRFGRGSVFRVRFGGPPPPSPGAASASAAAGGLTTGAAMAMAGGQPSSTSRQDGSRNHNPGGPTPMELLRVAVQRWAESRRALAGGGKSVLLQGPAVAGLVGSPRDVTAWVRRLAVRAGVAAGGSWGRAGVMSFSAIPPAAALLLQCDSKDTALAVAAAARAAELEAAAAAVAAGAVSAAGAVEAVAEEGSEEDAAAVAISVDGGGGCNLNRWAGEVAQEVLEGGHGAGAWSEPERVECVLQLWAELAGLLQEVRL